VLFRALAPTIVHYPQGGGAHDAIDRAVAFGISISKGEKNFSKSLVRDVANGKPIARRLTGPNCDQPIVK
jgi:hypothetical protein